MGGNSYRLKMKNQKKHPGGNKVNDPKTYRHKRKQMAVFHSVLDDLIDELDFE